MESQPSLEQFFAECDRLAALWRFDRIVETAEEVIFESEDEDNFVASFTWFQNQRNKGALGIEPSEECDRAITRVEEAVLGALKVPKLGTRIRMIRMIVRLGFPSALDPLLLILRGAESPDEREAAAVALGRIGLSEAGGALATVAADEGQVQGLRASAIRALGGVGPENHLEVLVRALESSDRWLCQETREVLEQVPAQELIPVLLREWTTTRWSTTGRLQAAAIIVRLGPRLSSPTDTAPYERFIRDGIGATESEAALAAVAIAEDLGMACKPELSLAVRSGHNDLRERALESLGKCGARAEVLACTDLISNEAEDVRIRVAAAKAAVAVGLERELKEEGLEKTVSELVSRPHQIQFIFTGLDGRTVDLTEAPTQKAGSPAIEKEDRSPAVEEEYLGDWSLRQGPISSARWAEPLSKLIYNYPTDTSWLKKHDLVVRDALKLAREMEGNRLSLKAAKAAFDLLPADCEAIHGLYGAALELFKNSYTDALAVTELTLHGAKRFADLRQRLMATMLVLTCANPCNYF